MSGARGSAEDFQLSSPNSGDASSSTPKGPERPLCRIEGDTKASATWSETKMLRDKKRKQEMERLQEQLAILRLEEAEDADDPLDEDMNQSTTEQSMTAEEANAFVPDAFQNDDQSEVSSTTRENRALGSPKKQKPGKKRREQAKKKQSRRKLAVNTLRN